MRNVLNLERTYQSLVQVVITHGERRSTRSGPTRALFGSSIAMNCLEFGEFPILTARQIFYKPVLGELAAFLRGATELKTFREFGCNYWDANAAAWWPNHGVPDSEHSVGRIYGAKWRDFFGHDQLKSLVNRLKHDPFSRRHILTAFDPTEEHHCLPPCHLMAQFNVTNANRLDCVVYMRSVDLCIGLPSDIILYATLQLLLCNETRYKPGHLAFFFGDTHVYENHIEPFQEMIQRETYPLPRWILDPHATLDNFTPEDFSLLEYRHEPKLYFPFNV